MAGLQNGPLPTKLCLLSDLGTFSPGDKVRFLGCIKYYSTKTAVLTLEHNHPPGNGVQALVNIDLLLEGIKWHESQIGEWINVMGYVDALKNNQSVQLNGVKMEVLVQAIVLWSAGPLKLDRYEKGLDQLKADESMALDTIP